MITILLHKTDHQPERGNKHRPQDKPALTESTKNESPQPAPELKTAEPVKPLDTEQITQQFFQNKDNQQWLLGLNKRLEHNIEQNNKRLSLSSFQHYRHLTLKEAFDQMATECFASSACREALQGNDFSKLMTMFPFIQHPGYLDLKKDTFEQTFTEYWQQHTTSKEPTFNLHQ